MYERFEAHVIRVGALALITYILIYYLYITGAISATVWRPHDARVGICHHHHAHTTPPSSLHHSDRVPGGTRWGRGGRPVPPGAQSRERRRGCTELGTAAKIQKCPFFFSFFSNHNHLSPFFASSHSIYIHYIPCGGLSDIQYCTVCTYRTVLRRMMMIF